ncbi:MAG: hypothetical protein ACI3YI_07440 [Bacteroidaceae bacterium]
MRNRNIFSIVLAATLFAANAFAQTKGKVQKREKYEFEMEIPTYVETLKQELTYPLSWEHSGIRSVAK